MLAIVQSFWFWILLASYWIFSAAVDAMPEVGPNSGLFYGWLHRWLHLVCGNAKSAFAFTERLQVALIEQAVQRRLKE